MSFSVFLRPKVYGFSLQKFIVVFNGLRLSDNSQHLLDSPFCQHNFASKFVRKTIIKLKLKSKLKWKKI